MLNNEWQIAQYPLAPGHAAIGTAAKADQALEHLPASRARYRIVLPNDL
jgi:hypothetical protein